MVFFVLELKSVKSIYKNVNFKLLYNPPTQKKCRYTPCVLEYTDNYELRITNYSLSEFHP